MAKGGSKAVTGVISFLLGFLFAIIVEIAAVVGVGVYVMTQPIENVLNTFGLQNTDENGKKVYVNTDKENGGVETVKELVDSLSSMFTQMDSLCIDKIEGVLPVTSQLMDMVYSTVGGIIELDKEKLESTVVQNLPNVLFTAVYGTKPGKLLEAMGDTNMTGDDANVLIKTLLLGAEADYATVYTGEAAPVAEGDTETEGAPAETFTGLPVFYDTYVYDEPSGTYKHREVESLGSGQKNAYPFEDTSWLQKSGTVKDGDLTIDLYKLYYVPCKVTDTGIVPADYEYKRGTKDYVEGGSSTECNYGYVEFGADTDYIAVKPDNNGEFKLNYNAIYAALNANSQSQSDRFTGYSYDTYYATSYYDLTYDNSIQNFRPKVRCGINFFKNAAGEKVELNPVILGDFVTNGFVDPLYSIKITELVQDEAESTEDRSTMEKVFKDTTLGAFINNEVDMDELVDDLELTTFVDKVSPDDKLMAEVVHKVSSLRPAGDGLNYTAVYDKGGENEQPAKVIVVNGKIYEVQDASGNVLAGATVKEVSNLSTTLTLDVLMDMKIDSPLLLYMGYGISGVTEKAGTVEYRDENNAPQTFDYGYVGTYHMRGEADAVTDVNCYVSVVPDGTDLIVDRVLIKTGETGELVKSTVVNDISFRIDTVTDYLTLPDFIDVDPEQTIMSYVSYGVSKLEKAADGAVDSLGNAYAYSGRYTPAGGGETDCFVKVKNIGTEEVPAYKITEVWYVDGGEKVVVLGTKLDQVGARTESLKNDLELGEIIEIGEDAPLILQSIKDSKIGNLSETVAALKVSQIVDPIELEKSPVLRQLKNTKVTELAQSIDSLLVQEIYAKEVYDLPADDDPMEVVDFTDGWLYYTVGEVANASGEGTTKKFVLANGTGALTQADFDNRGKTMYYTYGLTKDVSALTQEELAALGVESAEQLKIKLVGFSEEYLYYTLTETDGESSFNLVAGLIPDGASQTKADDLRGHMTQTTWNNRDQAVKYYSYGRATGMWRLILFKDVAGDEGYSSATKFEKGYSMNNFNNMVNVCAHNVYTATLGELQEAGVIPSDKALTPELSAMTFAALLDQVLANP